VPAPGAPFAITGPIQAVRTIATGGRIREIGRLVKRYGPGRWLKRGGLTTVRLRDGTTRRVEVHWYEAQGIGRKEIKIKRCIE
jgi:hypothetical protein